MPQPETTLTQKGQVTIPLPVRQALGLKRGDRIVFTVSGQQAIIERASSKLLAGYGAVRAKQHPEDFRAIREDFERGVAEDVAGEVG